MVGKGRRSLAQDRKVTVKSSNLSDTYGVTLLYLGCRILRLLVTDHRSPHCTGRGVRQSSELLSDSLSAQQKEEHGYLP